LTKAEVRQKLKDLHAEIDAGLKAPAGYSVRAAVDDWLADGLSGRSERTLALYRDGIRPLLDRIGSKQLRMLTAKDVRAALDGLSGHLSSRSLQIAHNCLERAIRHAQASDIVGRNVATLVRPPAGREGRPSKALTVAQAQALVNAARGMSADGQERLRDTPYRLCAYVVLLLMTGLRPEEARALRCMSISRRARSRCGARIVLGVIRRRRSHGGR
jgi:site-specific recombinase XerD